MSPMGNDSLGIVVMNGVHRGGTLVPEEGVASVEVLVVSEHALSRRHRIGWITRTDPGCALYRLDSLYSAQRIRRFHPPRLTGASAGRESRRAVRRGQSRDEV